MDNILISNPQFEDSDEDSIRTTEGEKNSIENYHHKTEENRMFIQDDIYYGDESDTDSDYVLNHDDDDDDDDDDEDDDYTDSENENAAIFALKNVCYYIFIVFIYYLFCIKTRNHMKSLKICNLN